MASKIEPPASLARNSGIDVLRGLAILLVVLHHLGLRIPLKKTALDDILPTRLLNALNYNGYEAVFVFFVISGFLIAGNTIRRWGSLQNIDMPAFYVRRFARIAPCLGALVVVLSVLHLLGVADYTITRAGQSLPRAIMAALGLHLNWYEGQTGYLPGNWDVLWSLSIEEVFYLGFPIVCLLVRNRFLLALLLLIFGMALPWQLNALDAANVSEVWREKAYLPGMAAIALGVFGALLVAHRHMSQWAVRWLQWLGGVGLTAVLVGSHWLWPWLHNGIMLLLCAATLCALIACHQREATRPLPGLGWLRHGGRLSYEIYLSHMFVVFAVVRLFHVFGSGLSLGWLWYVPTLPLCWLLGIAVERGLSTPCERWLLTRPMFARKNPHERPQPA